MSDRLAVFDEGRIVQVGAPAEVYEHPATAFVAGFVGTSNVLERDGRRFTVRPEKVRILENGAAPAGLVVERGRVTDVSYVGPLTRYVVALDAGGELQVVRQNLETSSAEALEEHGREVSVAWRRGAHVRRRWSTGGGGRSMNIRALWVAVIAAAALFVAAGCGEQREQQQHERLGQAGHRRQAPGQARRRRGPAEHHRLGRLRRGRLDRPEGRLGHAVREADRLPGQRQDRQHLRRDGHADAHRPLRRRLGVGRRDAAPDRGRRRRAGQHRPGPQLQGRLPRPEEPAVQLGRRADVRHPPRPRRQHPHVALGQGQARRWTPGARSSTSASQYKGKVTAYDSPIYIADAALYLKATKPDLKITNPYELDDKQFRRRSTCSRQQRANIGEYWSDYTKEQQAFANGNSVVGTTWQVIANLLDGRQGARSRRRCPRRARPAGRTPG